MIASNAHAGIVLAHDCQPLVHWDRGNGSPRLAKEAHLESFAIFEGQLGAVLIERDLLQENSAIWRPTVLCQAEIHAISQAVSG